MRIARFETFPIALPFLEPYMTATGTLERREMILLRIESDDGAVGWGDAVPLSLRGGAPLARLSDDLEGSCRAALEAAEIRLDRNAGAVIAPTLDRCSAVGAQPPALAAVDTALLDLLGAARGEPVWRLLGATGACAVRCNGTLGADRPDRVAEFASALKLTGFTTLKVKVGSGDDRERMRAVRAATGPETRLRIDANGAWNVETAKGEIAAIDQEVGLELVEQPSPRLEDLAAVRGATAVPIVADESVSGAADAERAMELGACDAVTIKLAKVGGVCAALAIAETLPAYLSSALDSPLGIAAAIHTAQALSTDGYVANLAHGLATSSLFADNVADDSGLVGPELVPGSGPGLGVRIDESAVRRLRIR